MVSIATNRLARRPSAEHFPKCSEEDFQAALNLWLGDHVAANSEGVVAVDGKTAKQGIDSDGNPLHMLNALAHDVRAVKTDGGMRIGIPRDDQGFLH